MESHTNDVGDYYSQRFNNNVQQQRSDKFHINYNNNNITTNNNNNNNIYSCIYPNNMID